MVAASRSGITASHDLFVAADRRRKAIENIVDADPVAARVCEIMADRAQWVGTATTNADDKRVALIDIGP